jgi:hypothetical protein
MLVVFGFGEKQSSPTLTRVFVTVRPSTLSESKPSVFLGRAWKESVLSSTNKIERAYRSIVAEGFNVYIVEGDILSTNQESRPARAVQESDTFNIHIGGVIGQE